MTDRDNNSAIVKFDVAEIREGLWTEHYALQRIVRGLGKDHPLRQTLRIADGSTLDLLLTLHGANEPISSSEFRGMMERSRVISRRSLSK